MNEIQKPTPLSSPDEVRLFAIFGNHNVLHSCIGASEYSGATWGETMQMAAIEYAVAYKKLHEQVIELYANRPPAPMILIQDRVGPADPDLKADNTQAPRIRT